MTPRRAKAAPAGDAAKPGSAVETAKPESPVNDARTAPAVAGGKPRRAKPASRASAAPPPDAEEAVEAPPFAPAVVTEFLRAFGRAMKAQQLYLPNNPMHAKAAEALRLGCMELWQQAEDVTLEIGDTGFRWFGEMVLEESEKSSESLSWLFYKDGVRELKISRGFEGQDLQILLALLQQARTASADDDDLLTLMWEEEFSNLEYRYVEAGGDGVPFEPIEAGEQPEKFEPPGKMADAVPERLASSAPTSAIVKMDDFDSTLYFLDEKEIEYLRTEIGKDFSSDLRPNVIAALLDTFEQQVDIGVREEIARILDNLLIVLLSHSQTRTVAYILREAAATAHRAPEITEVQRQRFEQLPDRLSDPPALTQLLETLEGTVMYPPQADLIELFTLLRPAALETIFSFVTRTQNGELRTLLEGAADRLAMSNTAELVRLIGSTDASVAVEAIQRAAAMKTAAAVPALTNVMTEGIAPSMRLAAVLALSDIGSPGALQTLEKALDDAERDIRVAAVRALGGRGYRAALPRVDRAIRGKALRETNLTEKMAFFEAFGALAGEAGVELLESILNGKGPLGRKDEAETRACAAMALGKIGTRQARESLERARDDKDVLVRNAVTRALRGGAP